MKRRERINCLITYCLLIIVFITSKTVYISMYGNNIYKLLYIAVIFIIIISFLKFKQSINHLLGGIFIIIYLLIEIIFIKNSLNRGYDYFILNILSMYIISIYFRKIKINIWEKISNIMVVYSILNLILYIIIIFLKMNISYEIFIEPYNNVVYSNYSNIFFYNHSQFTKLFSETFIRNSGIFFEAPMYAVFLNFALSYELFFSNRKVRIKNIIVLSISILTTLSTSGIILMIGSIVVYFICYKNKSKIISILKKVATPIIILITIFVSINIVDNKINNTSVSNGLSSVNARLDDFELGTKLFLEKPIIGWGYNNASELEKRQSLTYRGEKGKGSSNGLVTLMYQGGIYLFIFFFIGFLGYIKILKEINDNKIILLFNLVVLILTLLSEPYVFSPFVYLITTYGYVLLSEKYILYNRKFA